jgi:hypothetical protein
MAEAGFVFCGSKSEPDLVQCQVCLKKLDGWEQDDDPWYVGFFCLQLKVDTAMWWHVSTVGCRCR